MGRFEEGEDLLSEDAARDRLAGDQEVRWIIVSVMKVLPSRRLRGKISDG